LLNGTDIATIFLDNSLRIKRYTDQAKKVISLIPSDIGRPLEDLVSKLNYARLVEDAREVLDNLVFKEIEVRSKDGSWYFIRILPYRTAENVIEGLVITFVNFTRIRSLQERNLDSDGSGFHITWARGDGTEDGHLLDVLAGAQGEKLMTSCRQALQ